MTNLTKLLDQWRELEARATPGPVVLRRMVAIDGTEFLVLQQEGRILKARFSTKTEAELHAMFRNRSPHLLRVVEAAIEGGCEPNCESACRICRALAALAEAGKEKK